MKRKCQASIAFDYEIYNLLDYIAHEKDDVTISSLVRSAVDEFLEKLAKAKGVPLGDLISISNKKK